MKRLRQRVQVGRISRNIQGGITKPGQRIDLGNPLFALELAIRMTDLTTLEGQDTPGKVAAICSKAVRPDPADVTVPSVAAVCVYPNLVPVAVERVRGTGVKVASVATAFPSGQSPLDVKVRDVMG